MVESDPFLTPDETANPYNLGYPHRQAELLVFPRRRGTTADAERAAWSSLWEVVQARVIRFDPAVPMYQVQLPADAILEQAADRLLRQGHELIASIGANSCVFPQYHQGGSIDPEAGEQWGHWKIELQEAWKITTGAPTVVVAVMDSGINHQNPDLMCNFWKNPCDVPNDEDDACTDHPADGRIDDVHGWNFWDDDDNLVDNTHHGTSIAGIIGACHDTTGVVGTNWSVSLMDLRVYDTVAGAGALDAVLSAIPYAVANGTHVINMSWTTAAAPELKEAIESATSVIVTTSAGDHPTGAGKELVSPHTAFPCNWALPNLICVTSSTQGDAKAGSANYGGAVGIAAPGVDILTTQGLSSAPSSGTSVAAPYVAGVVALLKARFPLATTDEIVDRALSGDDIPMLAGMTKPGTAPGTGRRLNACRALGCPSPAPLPPITPLP